ncbi:hypothetical protein [Sulfitobacter sp. SK025]|uniref:hypothetical protein n=1 Tax=Sulfitobacter sp. SK025 TaxID=1389011 RepID=UPI000E0C751C|nr:hypothetical protein [Sulfitobacter sp. SK025]AXI50416.1 hypothetical protein C1J04_05610 [Sulfitobacter sp. SK025]
MDEALKKRQTSLLKSVGLELDMPLDEGIADAVHILRAAGIETIESCEGGEGHPFHEPTIRLCGGPGEGFRAYGVAVRAGLQPRAIVRIWTVDDGELTGPYWDLIFRSG